MDQYKEAMLTDYFISHNMERNDFSEARDLKSCTSFIWKVV